MSVRRELLEGAADLVDGDRNAQYGDPRQDFLRTAELWNTYLGLEEEGRIEPHDVAAMMALLKVSRIRWSPLKEDSWMDLAGYAACGWHCASSEDEDDEPYVRHIRTVTEDPLYQTLDHGVLSDESIRLARAAGFRWAEDAFGNHLLVRGG